MFQRIEEILSNHIYGMLRGVHREIYVCLADGPAAYSRIY